MTTQPTGTVTFLFTDIEGSTRLWESAPDKMEGVLSRHDEILNQQITASSGYVFTTAGDAFSAAFTDPRDAAAAAIDCTAGAGSRELGGWRGQGADVAYMRVSPTNETATISGQP